MKLFRNCINDATCVGTLSSNFSYDHEAYGKKYYKATLDMARTSGTVDRIWVVVPENEIDPCVNYYGIRVMVRGSFSSHGYFDEIGKHHMKLFLKSYDIKYGVEEDDFNEIVLSGYLCKNPIYRVTDSREIADILVACNRRFSVSYIPCILWGYNARDVSRYFGKGQMIRVSGRIQSRWYQKKLDNGDIEEKVAYEVSVNRIFEEVQNNNDIYEN